MKNTNKKVLGARVLVAEDEKKIRDGLKDILENEGYQVFQASNGKEALKITESHAIDVALLDIRMPIMDGIEVLKKIKEMDESIEALIMTGYADLESLKETIVDHGAFDYLLKPFNIKELIHSVQNALQKRDSNLQTEKRGLRDRITQLEKDFEEKTRELRETQIKYRNIIEKNADGIIIVDREGIVRFVNPAAETLFGQEKEALLGELFGFPLVAGETTEIEVFSRSAETCQVEMRAAETEWEGETAFLASLRDITKSKQAETKIREYSKNLERMVEERTRDLHRALNAAENARDRIDAILKSVAGGLIVTDLSNRVILMNRGAEDLLGVRYSEVVGRPIDFAIEDRTLRERIKTPLAKKESGYQFDFELPGNEPKHTRIIRGRTSMIEDKSGKQTGIVTIMHDVTHEREVDRMKTEFLSTATHELRNPLTSIQGFSEILLTREDIEEEEKKKFLAYINKQAVGLAAIVNDLLDIARIESGKKVSLEKVSCDMGVLIRRIVPYFREQSQKHQFEVVLPEQPVELMVDMDKMEQLFKNILSNAIKYSPEGGRIRVRGEQTVSDTGCWDSDLKQEEKSKIPARHSILRSRLLRRTGASPARQPEASAEADGRSGDAGGQNPKSKIEFQISVEDEGIGMTREQVDRIFDKFYRADASNTAVDGTGLGMSIVNHIAEEHGGRVWVESELGKGTKVKVRIPMKIDD